MIDPTLISTVVGQLAIIGSDPALGYRGQALTSALALLSTIIARGDEAHDELEELSEHVKQMVEEDREPTKDEWNDFRNMSKRNHDILNPPEEEDESSDDLGEKNEN